MKIREMSDAELRSLFEERKRLLLEVRDEIDRRERDRKPVVEIDFTKYVGDGIE